LVVLDKESDCFRFAVSLFTTDLLDTPHLDVRQSQAWLDARDIPNFEVTGRSSDFKKRGVWLGADHAWAVVGLTEYTNKFPDSQN